MRDFWEAQIAEGRRCLAAIDSARDKLIGLLAAYESALAKTGEGSSDLTDFEHSNSEESLRVSGAWFVILRRMAEFEYFNAGDVEREGHTLFKEGKLRKALTKDGIRAQLSLYVKKKILKRRGGGHYLLTDNTKATLKRSSKTSLGQS